MLILFGINVPLEQFVVLLGELHTILFIMKPISHHSQKGDTNYLQRSNVK